MTHQSTEGTKRILQKVLALRREVDECKPLPAAGGGALFRCGAGGAVAFCFNVSGGRGAGQCCVQVRLSLSRWVAGNSCQCGGRERCGGVSPRENLRARKMLVGKAVLGLLMCVSRCVRVRRLCVCVCVSVVCICVLRDATLMC